MNLDTWWYGFKEAERLFYEGYVPDYNDTSLTHVYFVKDYTSVGIPTTQKQRKKGVLDYIVYWEENKELISKARSK